MKLEAFWISAISCLILVCLHGCSKDDTQEKNPESVITAAWNADDSNVQLSGYVVNAGREVTIVFEYGTDPNYLDKKTYVDSEIEGDTTFVRATVSGLSKSTTYYTRISAIKTYGKFNSETISFSTTEFPTPTIVSFQKEEVTSESFVILSKINPADKRSVAWIEYGTDPKSLSQRTENSIEFEGTTTVDVYIYVTGLETSKIYYYWIVSENEGGKRYSNITQVCTNEGTVADYDGKLYGTTRIGSQVWITSNWACDKYADGSVIDSCFVYNEDEAKINIYGRLYTYDALIKKNIAPPGWRVPTKADWLTLIKTLGGEYQAGGWLKAQEFLSPSSDVEIIDQYNFSSIPSGMRNGAAEYFHEKDNSVSWFAYYWGLTDESKTEGFRVYITYIYEGLYPGKAPKENAYSVRLIKE